MKTIFSGSIFLLALVWCIPSFGAPPERLNWGQMLNSNNGRCDQSSNPIISVVEKVKGDADSGVAGNYWAYDTFSRTIKVWPQGGGTYCAVVEYHGQFQAIAGQITPAGSGVLTGEEDGAFEGGYIATFTGTLLSTPLWKTNGSVGSVIDYKCDATGDCPGYVDWVAQYFNYSNFDQPTWGWVYHGGPDGTWVNALSGNSGNIQ